MKISITSGLGFIGSALIRHSPTETIDAVVNIDKLTYAAFPKAVGVVVADLPERYASIQAGVTEEAATAETYTK